MSWAANARGRFAGSTTSQAPIKGRFTMTSVSDMSLRPQPAHGTIHWLNACIEKGKSSVFSEVVTLNPGIAAELLRRNEMNRSVRSVKSAQYAADIRSGRLVFNG